MRDLLQRGERQSLDREMHLAELSSAAAAAALRFRGEPYGLQGSSHFDLYRAVARYRLGEEVAQITTPLLITDPEEEQFWPGQSQQLYHRLPGPKLLIEFTAHEGASRHCEPLAAALRETRIIDWLEQYLTEPHPARKLESQSVRTGSE